MKRYYEILGLPEGAGKNDIKRAYRKLALQYHPDHNKSPGAREHFLQLTEAYNYLLDPPQLFSDLSKKKAEEERKKRAQEMAKKAARQRYAAFKRKQEIEQSKSYSQGVSIFVGLLLIVAAFYFGQDYFVSWYVNQAPKETIGHITDFGMRKFAIEYTVNERTYIERISGTRSQKFLVTPNGMPVVYGAEFLVVYNKNDPSWCEVDFEKITPLTLRKYVKMISEEAAAIFDLPSADNRVECASLQLFNSFGFDGLANVFFWRESPMENFKNNSFTFELMEESEEYQTILKDCLITQRSIQK